MNRIARGFRGGHRGLAVVELALVLIPLSMMMLATIEFARAMWIYDQLAKAVRDGVRYISFFDPAVASEYPTSDMRMRMVFGMANPPSGAQPILPGLSSSMIQICDRVTSSNCPGEAFANVNTGSGSINLVKVTISGYRFTPVFPGASRMPSIQFGPISATMRQVYP